MKNKYYRLKNLYKFIFIVFYFFGFLMCVDLVTTYIGISMGYDEANKLLNFILVNYGLEEMLIFKGIISILGFYLFYRYIKYVGDSDFNFETKKLNLAYILFLCIILAVFYSWVFINNILIINL